jgi:hypothetical protein
VHVLILKLFAATTVAVAVVEVVVEVVKYKLACFI